LGLFFYAYQLGASNLKAFGGDHVGKYHYLVGHCDSRVLPGTQIIQAVAGGRHTRQKHLLQQRLFMLFIDGV
jgi:hypothetical protein